MSSAQLYDTIGAAYTVTRRTEPRIAGQVWAALGDARTVLNVGAGTGSYEPSGRDVTAVEPSAVMRAQRPAGAAPSRCPSRGTARTASTKPTGAGLGPTSTSMSAAACRSGPGSGRTPSSGQCTACVMTSHPAGGPSATATSSISTRQCLTAACSSPDPVMAAPAWGRTAPGAAPPETATTAGRPIRTGGRPRAGPGATGRTRRG